MDNPSWSYVGIRYPDGRAEVLVRPIDNRKVKHEQVLSRRFDVAKYASEFDWGYEGAEAYQLALAMLCHFEEIRAGGATKDWKDANLESLRFQAGKLVEKTISNMDYDGWEINNIFFYLEVSSILDHGESIMFACPVDVA